MIIMRFLFPCIGHFNVLSANYISFMFSSTSMLWHIVFMHHSSALANKGVSYQLIPIRSIGTQKETYYVSKET